MNPGSIKALLGAVLLAASFCTLAQKSTLTVYTALETDQLKAYEAGFNKVNPNIEIKWCVTPPVSSPPSCSPRRPIRRPTW